MATKKSLRLASSNPPVLSLVFPGRDSTDYLTKGIIPKMVALRNTLSPIVAPERHVSIMTYVNSSRQAIPLIVDQREEISICLVDQSSGAVLTHGCFRYLFGPSRFVLVASEFSHLYYLVEGDKCTCPQKGECEHCQDGWLVNAVRGNKLVETPWCELTQDEQTEANNVLFAPCDLEARWESATW